MAQQIELDVPVRSFGTLFGDLPAEIRLMIWDHLVLSVIEVIEIWPKGDGGFNSQENNPRRLTFHPDLMTIAQACQPTHPKLAAAIDRLGLSFDITLVSSGSVLRLVRQFDQPSVPKIRLLQTRTTRDAEHLKSDPLIDILLQQYYHPFENLRTSAPVKRFERIVDGRIWKTEAEETLSNKDLPGLNSEDHKRKAIAYYNSRTASSVDIIGFGNLVRSMIVEGGLIDIVNIDHEGREVIAQFFKLWGYDRRNPPDWGGHCGLTPGTPRLQDAQVADSSEPTLYHWELHFDWKHTCSPPLFSGER